jgi:RNA polymerase sigma-70 factor (ECF subfamily)
LQRKFPAEPLTRFLLTCYDPIRVPVLRLIPAQSSSALPGRHDELEALARRAHDGDPAAIRTFVTAIGPQILRVVRRVLGPNHPDVEDAAQESAFAVLGALGRYRGDSTVVHFACRVAVQTAMNVRRRESAVKRRAQGDRVDLDALADGRPGPEAEAEGRASAELVRELVATLPEAQAEALALHCVLGFTVGEIAETAGLPVETVRSRLRLAKNALRARAESTPRLARLVEVAG